MPEFNDKRYINIKKGRHPLIDSDKVVPINVCIGDKYDQLIITGPNTGGKTVTLKTVGLFSMMGQSGLHIPAADNSELTVFDDIFADDNNISMDELYEIAKRNALELYNQDLFKNTVLVIGKGTGVEKCHEIIFLVHAMESENVYDEIEDTIYQNVWKIDRKKITMN